MRRSSYGTKVDCSVAYVGGVRCELCGVDVCAKCTDRLVCVLRAAGCSHAAAKLSPCSVVFAVNVVLVLRVLSVCVPDDVPYCWCVGRVQSVWRSGVGFVVLSSSRLMDSAMRRWPSHMRAMQSSSMDSRDSRLGWLG